MRRPPFKFAFVYCKDADDAAEFLAFHSRLKQLSPTQWVAMYSGYERISPRIADVIAKANRLMEPKP